MEECGSSPFSDMGISGDLFYYLADQRCRVGVKTSPYDMGERGTVAGVSIRRSCVPDDHRNQLQSPRNCLPAGGVEEFIAGMAKTRGTTPSEVEKEFFQTVRASSLLKRFASVDEVAALVAFVASPVSSATNGAAMRVEGGVLRSIF